MKGFNLKKKIKCDTRLGWVTSNNEALSSAGDLCRWPNIMKCFVLFGLFLAPAFVFAEDLLADEQGPTAPEAIATVTANEDFLTPTYTVPAQQQPTPVPSEVDILNEIFGSDTPEITTASVQNPKPVQRTFSPRVGIQNENEPPLLTPLPPLPIITAESEIPARKTYFKQTNYADQALALGGTPSSGIGIPREIRITFYKNQSTLSAQALKWVKSFAMRVVNDPRLLAEIRFSDQNPKIQEKRLSLLLQVLKEAGLSAHQIRLYKTRRDENSILIGYVENPDDTPLKIVNKSTERTQKTIDW